MRTSNVGAFQIMADVENSAGQERVEEEAEKALSAEEAEPRPSKIPESRNSGAQPAQTSMQPPPRVSEIEPAESSQRPKAEIEPAEPSERSKPELGKSAIGGQKSCVRAVAGRRMLCAFCY
jgi:hypothetical protein